MKTWAESKQIPGQFTGSTGAKVLTPAELSSGYQAWARKVKFIIIHSIPRTKCVPKPIIPKSLLHVAFTNQTYFKYLDKIKLQLKFLLEKNIFDV